MKIPQKLRKLFLKIGCAILLFLAVGYYFFVTQIAPTLLKEALPRLESLAPQYMNGAVAIGGLSWQGGLSVSISDVKVWDATGELLAELPITRLEVRPWLALGGAARALTRVDLAQPSIYLRMDAAGKWNTADFLKESDSEETPFYGLLAIQEGAVELNTPYGCWRYTVEGTASGGANPDFALDLALKSDATTDFRLQGITTTAGVGNLTLESKRLELEPYAPLAEHYGGVAQLAGAMVGLHLRYSNDGAKTRYSGALELDNLRCAYAFSGKTHNFAATGELSIADSIISTKQLELQADGQKVLLKGSIDVRDSTIPTGSIVLTGEHLAYENYAIEKITLPVTFTKELIEVPDASFTYGGGFVKAEGFYLPESNMGTASLFFDNVRHKFGGAEADELTVNGSAAFSLQSGTEKKLNVTAAAEGLQLGWRNLELAHFTFDGAWDGERLEIAHLGARGSGGSLALSGSVATNGALALEGRMAHFPLAPFLVLAGEAGSGYASVALKIGGSTSAPELGGLLELQEVELRQQQIRNASGFVGLANGVLTLKNFDAQMQQGRHSLSGSIDFSGAEAVYNLAVDTQHVRMEPLLATAGLSESVQLTGNFDNVMQISGPLSNLKISGEACLSDGSAYGYLLDSVAGRYIYANGAVYLPKTVIKTLGSELELGGWLKPDGALDFALKARDLSLERLPLAADDCELAGKLDADGHLVGSLKQPYFDGKISSAGLSINGEKLSELSGSLKSNGKDINKLSASFRQPYQGQAEKYGLYQAELTCNLPRRDLRGTIVVERGDVGGILRLLRQDYDLEGQLNGAIFVNQEGAGSGIVIDSRIEDVKIHDLQYYGMSFLGRVQKQVLTLEDVRLQEQAGVEDKGIIKLGGSIDLSNGRLAIKMDTLAANPAVVTALMHDPPAINGLMDIQLTLNGSLAEPQGSAELLIRDGSFAGVSVDKLMASLSLADEQIRLTKLEATKDIYGVKAQGRLPLDLFRSKAERRNPRAQMDISVDLSEARLGILPALSEQIEWGVGAIEGQIRATGTLEEPLFYGKIKIQEGSVKVKQLDTVIDKIHSEVAFDGNKIQLYDLSALLGKGKLTLSGSYALRADERETYQLSVIAEDAELKSSVFSGRINSKLEIVPERAPRQQRSGQTGVAAVIYRPKIKGQVRLDDVLLNISSVPDTGESDSSYGLDLALELGPKIHMLNPYFYDIWLKGGLEIKGSTDFPQISGNIKSARGSITYLRTPFKLQNASLAWLNQGSFLPNVSLESTARFSRYRIYMKINGPVETMDLGLTSDPPLEKNTIVRMLTLQRDTEGSADVTSDDVNNLMTLGLEMTVLGDVEMWIKQTLGLDQFRIYNGKARSGIGYESYKDRSMEMTEEERKNYNVLVSKYLLPALMVGYTSSFDGESKTAFGQLDISRHFNITYSHKYEEISSNSDDWYGLEYKISF